MQSAFRSKALLAICGALVLLLGALTVLQYRWSGRVAAADLQRERESLEAAATLFSREVGAVIGQAMIFLQEEAWAALSTGKPLEQAHELLAEVYFLEMHEGGQPSVRRLMGDGSFAPAPMPDWLASPRCAMLLQDEPPAVVSPIADIHSISSSEGDETRLLRTFRWLAGRCFVARIDEAYLRDVLFPTAIRQSFGAAALGQYDFTVASARRPDELLYGGTLRADLRKRFGASPNQLVRRQAGLPEPPVEGAPVLIERRERVVVGGEPDLLQGQPPDGIWELRVSRKGGPLEQAIDRRRRRELLFAFGVEGLLVAALIFLALGIRRAQRLADQRMQFVASVSHELRTPASAIAMLARNQADGLVTEPDKVREYGELIHQQSRRLNETVEQTLAFAGIQSGFRRPAKEPVALGPALEQIIEARRPEIERGGFELELALEPDLPKWEGDANLLRTAVDNLLSNALKHAVDGRWARVSAVHDRDANEVRIAVADRGPGVPAAERQEIFEPFRRGRVAMEEQLPGSGLGLSLVRGAAEAHGGSVTVESEPGRGSVFTLHLPV